MNVGLANILFENETLYFVSARDGDAVISAVSNNVEKPEINKSELADKQEPINTKILETVETKNPENTAEEIKQPKVAITNEQKQLKNPAELIVIVKDFNAEKKEFLAKILSALNRNIDDIPVYDINASADIDIRAIIAETKALFSFGVPFTSLGFKADLTTYVLKMAKEKHYLMGDPLEIIMLNQNNEKRMLWDALRGIF